MDEDEILNARQVAEQNPELDATRRQLFGENYLQDIDRGTGIAQYYTGFGEMPTLDYTPAVVEEAAPVVDITQPVVDSGGGGGGGSDIDITTPDTGNTDFEQNLLDQGIGVQAEQGISPISAPGEGMLTQQAIDELADYPLNTSYGVGGVDGMSGGEATPGAEFADQNPYGGTGTMDDLGADSFPEYQEPTVATYGDTTTGLEGYLDGIDLSTGRAETIDTRADQPPSLGFGNAPEADIYRDPIMDMANMNQADVIASDANVGFNTPEQTNAIGDAFNSVKDLGAAGVDKFKDSLIALGGKVKEGFDNTIEIGGKTIDLTKSLIGGALSFATGIPGISFALNAIKEDPMQAATKQGLEEQGYGFDDIGRLTTGPMAGYNVESAFGDGIADATLDRIDKIENRDAPQTEASIKKVQELYNFLGDVTEVKAAETAPQEDIGAISRDMNTGVDQDIINRGQQVERGTSGIGDNQPVTSTTKPGELSTSTYDAELEDERDVGGGGNQGGGSKIVCTMMNDSYGFGSFRNKIWLRHSKDLAPEYQIGYHKIFLPLVKLSKTNKILKKTLEHIAVHRTIDIRQEARGKMHLLGRIYRKILEPICYIVGKHAKR